MTHPRYRTAHQRERAAWAPLVAAGTVRCWRDGELIAPGEPWDLGHRDGLPSHPEHATCNRSAGARAGNRSRNPISEHW